MELQNKKYLAMAAIPVIAAALIATAYSFQVPTQQSNVATDNAKGVAIAQSPPRDATGNLTVYILPINRGAHSTSEIVETIQGFLTLQDASYYTAYGVSPAGQYAERTVPADQDLTTTIKKGDLVSKIVFEKGPETVKFYIDSDVKKRDGTPLTREDFAPDYLMGNGVTCCGVELADGTYMQSVVLFVADQSLDTKMMIEMDAIKASHQLMA
ncbi:hypothetical protein [Candidatus Nitrososphaera sp. FF02]|uniref:hypothetical protein n=1 Tax=Candidatus Nitrososphaera sp. FF02 TaxID=3398226 RepID=UPI0039E7F3D5